MDPYNSGRVSGFVVGAFDGVSKQVRDLADLVACELIAEHPALFDGAMNVGKRMISQRIRRSIGLAVPADGPNCFSKDAVALIGTHGSRVLKHPRKMRTAPRHVGSFISTRPAGRARQG